MSRFFSQRYRDLTPYTPGEQPKDTLYLKLNTNESPFPPSPLAQKYAKNASGSLNLYSDPESTILKKASAKALGVPESRLIFTNSSDETLNFAFMAFCDESRPAIFPDITYGFYPVFAQVHCVPYREIPLKDDFTIDPADYSGMRGTIFLANPNAPTGVLLPLSAIESILKSNPESIVVVDEAYIDFGGESAIALLPEYENLLVVRTFSKSRSLAGGRLGIGIANESLIRDLKTIQYSINPYNVNSMTMAAGAGALEDTEYFEKTRREIIENRAVLTKKLKALGFSVLPSAANFVFAKSPKISGEALYLKLKEKKILIRHFSLPRIADYNRITVGTSDQIETLIAAIAEILEE